LWQESYQKKRKSQSKVNRQKLKVESRKLKLLPTEYGKMSEEMLEKNGS